MATTDRYPTIRVPEATQQDLARPLLLAANVTAVGPGIRVKGRLSATEHVIIEGIFEGDIVVPDHGVAIGGAAHLRGDVCARAITVLGRVDGNLTAFALIELRATAVVTGRLAGTGHARGGSMMAVVERAKSQLHGFRRYPTVPSFFDPERFRNGARTLRLERRVAA